MMGRIPEIRKRYEDSQKCVMRIQLWVELTDKGHVSYKAPKKLKRRFPNGKEKRQVECCISTFVGHCADASHYYARLTEEHNPVWSPSEKAWVYAKEDVPGLGKEYEAKLFSREQAEEWAAKTFKLWFGEKTHRLVELRRNSIPGWFYKYDGD